MGIDSLLAATGLRTRTETGQNSTVLATDVVARVWTRTRMQLVQSWIFSRHDAFPSLQSWMHVIEFSCLILIEHVIEFSCLMLIVSVIEFLGWWMNTFWIFLFWPAIHVHQILEHWQVSLQIPAAALMKAFAPLRCTTIHIANFTAYSKLLRQNWSTVFIENPFSSLQSGFWFAVLCKLTFEQLVFQTFG
jgi:hypothetical protein